MDREMEEFLVPSEVASRLGVTLKTVYKWLQSGRVRGIKVGGSWRIRSSDLDDSEAEEPVGSEELELLTPSEIAYQLKVSERTVYNWLRKGILPGLKIGGSWRVSASTLSSPSIDLSEE